MLNDILLGAVSSSVSEYMTERKFPFVNNKINVVYNMMTTPKSKQEFYYYNFAYSEMMDMKFSTDFKDCMK